MKWTLLARRFFALLAFSGPLLVFGCTPSTKEASEAAAPQKQPSEPARAPTVASSQASGSQPSESRPGPAATPIEPAKKTDTKDGEKRPIPDALKDLKEKLQPSNLPSPPARPGARKLDPAEEKVLLEGAAALAKTFLLTLQKGDAQGALAMTFTKEQFEKLISPGYRDILEGSVLADNQARVKALAEKLKGKEIKETWKPGPITMTQPSNLFRSSLPLMSDGTLFAEVDGVSIQIKLDQLVLAETNWTIFRLSTH
jgi:hypothetical protein